MSTKIKLNKKDSALVIKEDGTIELSLPEIPEDGEYSKASMFLASIAWNLTKDNADNFVNNIVNEFINEAMKEK